MKLKRIDPLLAESRKYTVVQVLGHGYSDVECPFCGTRSLVFEPNVARGTRCKYKECRAMLQGGRAWRDMVPEEEVPAR